MSVPKRLITDARHRVGERLSAEEDRREAAGLDKLSVEDRRQFVEKEMNDELARLEEVALREGLQGLTPSDEDELKRSVIDDLLGLGRIQPLIDDPRIVNIHINGYDSVFVEHADGTKHGVGPIASSNDELVRLISRVGRNVGRSERQWDDSTVELDLQLPNGDRLNAVRGVSGRPVVTIRSHNWEINRLSHLVERDTMSPLLADFLVAAVKGRLNLVVAGGTNTGKTTMLRCLLNAVSPEERLITIEDNLEIGVDRFPTEHPDHVTLEARPPNIEGVGEKSLSELTRMALRMNPSRIIVGEVRGPEITEMLMAMSTGNEGSMCSIHANSSAGALVRMVQYALMGEWDEPTAARVISNAVDLIAHIGWVDGVRTLTSVREVVGVEDRQIITNEVFVPSQSGRAVPSSGLVMSDDSLRRLERHDFDRARLVNGVPAS